MAEYHYGFAIGALDYAVSDIGKSVKETPETVLLHQNYPNPFNPTTTIEFSLSQSAFVELRVFNILGNEVANLVSKNMNPGSHTFQFDATRLASGIYYCQLTAGDYMEVMKMILLR